MKRAFTLIELLVVIAIIAILAAILFPVFAQAKLAAKGAASLSNVKQLALANLMYANDYDDQFVSEWIEQTGVNPSWGWQSSWGLDLLPYIKSYGIFLDPADSLKPQTSYNSGPKVSYIANGTLEFNQASGWMFHGVINMNGDGGSTSWYQNGTTSQSQINHVADTIMFATCTNVLPMSPDYGNDPGIFGDAWDGLEQVVNQNHTGTVNGVQGSDLAGLDSTNWWGGAGPDPNWKGAMSREYAGKSPNAFTDGHAKTSTPEALENWSGFDNTWGQLYREGVTKPFQGDWDALRQ